MTLDRDEDIDLTDEGDLSVAILVAGLAVEAQSQRLGRLVRRASRDWSHSVTAGTPARTPRSPTRRR